MPEIRECIAHFLYLKIFYDHSTANYKDLRVLGLWADASLKEHEAGVAPDGNVYRLTPDSTALRGSKGGQTSLWPPMLQETEENPDPTPISTLVWKGISHTSRAIVLNFGELYFQLAYLTHTSIQVFSRDVWEEVVRKTPKTTRGYRIGLAIEFEHQFVAFLTIDQMIQVNWALSRSSLPKPPSDVYGSFFDFLNDVAAWITQRAKSSRAHRSGFACKAMRKANKVWGGVGVYTVIEIFFLAGLSPFLSEKEVFDNPSRTARLCCALWTFASISHSEEIMKKLIKPAVQNGIVAPTKPQRLKYGRWLHVYAKHRAHGSIRMIDLISEYKNRLMHLDSLNIPWFRDNLNDSKLYDFFEPTLLLPCYQNDNKHLFLGSLIFGNKEWTRLCPDPGRLTGTENPLTEMFQCRGLLSSPSYLKLGRNTYDRLFLPDERRILTASHCETYVYRDTTEKNGKQMWSVVPIFGKFSSSHSSVPDKTGKPQVKPPNPTAELIVDLERRSMLFFHIVRNTNKVAIGPLEYCGNGTVAYTTHGTRIVSAVRIPRRSLVLQHRESLKSGSASRIQKSEESTEYESEREEEEDFELPDYIDDSSLDVPNPPEDDAIFGIQSRSSSSGPGWTTDEPPETEADDTGSSIAMHSDNEIPNQTKVTKKRKRYSTGDRETVDQSHLLTIGLPSNGDEGEAGAQSTSSGRPVRTSRNKDPHQFVRVRWQYNRQK